MSMKQLQSILDTGVKLTPMMEQYISIKKQYPDTILFFRMGDFYEVFFDDATETAKILNIAQTQRGKLGEHPIPMAGIPHHAAATYITRITDMGKKVAICEQVEDPKQAKGIVKRAVTQIVSPGMPYDIDKTESQNRFIGAGFFEKGTYYLVLIDFTTGQFNGHKFSEQSDFFDRIRISAPKEFISYIEQWENHSLIYELVNSDSMLITNLKEEHFCAANCEHYIEKLIPSFKQDNVLKSESSIINPIGALAFYICSTQYLEDIIHIHPFKMESPKGKMRVTLQTLEGIEIFPKAKESYQDSLLGFMDKTLSAVGSRTLKNIFLRPLTEKKEITIRQKLIEFFHSHQDHATDCELALKELRDIERILVKVSTKKINSSDLINLSRATTIYSKVTSILKKSKNEIFNFLAPDVEKSLNELASTIDNTINEDVGASLEKGNLIKTGVNKQRDRLAQLCHQNSDALNELEEKYRKTTGINNLKVKQNNVAGYFIEVSKAQTSKVPKSFQRKQTLTNSERYLTDELLDFEKEVLASKLKLEKIEKKIFNDIVAQIELSSADFLKLSNILGLADTFLSFSKVSLNESFVKPQFGKEIEIQGGWHPLIKASLKNQFVEHNIYLNEENYFGLITGPNMAGKTTVMREIAIIQFLFQLGCYVPAHQSKLPICDALFSRLGASDNILKGQSTFMVEMAETAEILRHATQKSMIILDEVGRGTSTHDGMSIAWALVEYLVNEIKSYTLFSTHYHELIELVNQLKGAKNFTVDIINNGGDLKFLYELVERGANESFGIYVAKLAGLPNNLLLRSSEILSSLETTSKEDKLSKGQLSLFNDIPIETPEYLLKLEEDIKNIDISKLTPLDALNKINELKENYLQ